VACRYQFDDVQIDPQSFRLFKAGDAVPVEPKALNLLIFLVKNRGRLVERRELIDVVWGDAFVTDHVLNRAIGQLRKLLADDAKEPRYIETVPTLGYRFIGHVEEMPEAAAGSLSSKSEGQQQPAAGIVSVPSSGLWRRAPLILALTLLAVAGVVTAWIEGQGGHSSASMPIRSLAVLPLENLSGDASQEYLADGMTDELITGLGQISALRVISRTTAMQYKNAHKSLPQIARELNVDAVVEGSVERSGERIRIAAQLVQATADKELWAKSYEGSLADVLGLQNQVASAVAEQIRVELTPNERTQLTGARQGNPRAYEAFFKAESLEEQNTPESWRKALLSYQEAAQLDPDFARAYVGIARSHNYLNGWGVVPAGEAIAGADAANAKALELDPELAEAYDERAWTLMFFHWDFPGAERDFRRALELDPGSSDTHDGLADYLVALGRFDEGFREAKRARDLDPLSPVVNTDYCRLLEYAHRYDDALAQCDATLKLDPNYTYALNLEADLYARKGEYAKAHKIVAMAGGCDARCIAMMDEIYGAPGVAGSFDVWLKAQKAQPDAFFLAGALASLGRKDEAFAWLEKAYEQRAGGNQMIYVSMDPSFDRLHSDPRFDAFLSRAGLPRQSQRDQTRTPQQLSK
jgi:TolB-like protein/DNA-binding winged helix-turn-helix (wHTH) protein